MKDLLEQLNQDQERAVTQLKKDVLLIGGAGCGKTKVILHKIAWILTKKKAKPEEILVLTYSRFTGRHFSRELADLGISEENIKRIRFRTFHELGLEIIRKNPELCGLKKDFSLYDETDQIAIIERACRELGIENKYDSQTIFSRIIQAKSKLIDSRNFLSALTAGNQEFNVTVDQVYTFYSEFLARHNAVDYEDVLNNAVHILTKDKKTLTAMLRKHKFIFIDEYQDLSLAQYNIVKLLHTKTKFLTVAGNDDQCVVAGTPILTPEGSVPIETLVEGQEVVSCIGGGKTSTGKVESISTRPYNGVVTRITLEDGRCLRLTPNHVIFSKFNIHANLNYVYLAKRPDVGYRIGFCQGLSMFLEPKKYNQLEGDRFWILSVHEGINDTQFHEALYSNQYGIPTAPFSIQGNIMSFSDKHLKELYRRIDTWSRAEVLMNEMNIQEEYPHYISVARTRSEDAPRVLSVTMFGHKEKEKNEAWYPHRISMDTQKLPGQIKTIMSPKERDHWLVDATRQDYKEIMHFARTLSGIDELMIVERARLSDKSSFFQIPASHIRRKMLMPILTKNGKVEEKSVVDVTFEEYDGQIHDIGITHLHNFVAADVVIHNSINAWKGSDLLPLVNFSRDFKDAMEIKLERNYRSTKSILWSANELVRNNINRIEKNLWTENDMGEKIVSYKALNEQDEIYYAINQMRQLVFREEKKYSHFLFLFRTFAQSKILTDVLYKEGIPYILVGRDSPFHAREIKDILAYLKILVNHYDNYSLLRILNVPRRGIGDKSIECLENHSIEQKIPIWECLDKVNEIEGLPLKSKNTILNFKDLMTDLADDIEKYTLVEFIENVIERTGYHKELKYMDSTLSENGTTNIEELMKLAEKAEKEGHSLGDFLEDISIVDRQSSINLQENSVLLTSIHETIGLEHPVVFILGMEEGVFPNDKISLKFFDLEEERRVLYQGMMRARERLFLINAQVRRIFGSVFENCPSRFLEELPEELVINLDSELVKEHRPENQKPITNRPAAADSEYGLTFSEDDRVKHSMWGIGTVVDSTGDGDDLMVTVDFINAGIKKLLIKYAPLERI